MINLTKKSTAVVDDGGVRKVTYFNIFRNLSRIVSASIGGERASGLLVNSLAVYKPTTGSYGIDETC